MKNSTECATAGGQPQASYGNAVKRSNSGWIYFIQGHHGGPVKIGFAKEPKLRLRELQVGSPVPLRILGRFRGTREDERALHARLFDSNKHGEWFTFGPDLDAIFLEKLGKIPTAFCRTPFVFHGEYPVWVQQHRQVCYLCECDPDQEPESRPLWGICRPCALKVIEFHDARDQNEFYAACKGTPS